MGQITMYVNGILLLWLVWIDLYSTIDDRCHFQRSDCDVCGLPVSVTLTVRNVLDPPTFEFNMSVIVRHGALLKILEEAAEVRNAFRFKTTYLPSMGYFIDAINRQEGSTENKTFWQVISQDFGPLECGVSWYMPADGETILFNFTTYSDAGHTANTTDGVVYFF